MINYNLMILLISPALFFCPIGCYRSGLLELWLNSGFKNVILVNPPPRDWVGVVWSDLIGSAGNILWANKLEKQNPDWCTEVRDIALYQQRPPTSTLTQKRLIWNNPHCSDFDRKWCVQRRTSVSWWGAERGVSPLTVGTSQPKQLHI